MKNLFIRVKKRLLSTSDTPIEGHALKRINNLSGFITGMIRKGSSHLPDIGSGLPQDIDAQSKTVAAKRFVEHKKVSFKLHFLPFLTAFLQGILASTYFHHGFVLAIDGSQIGKDNAALMVSLIWGNRSIPICWLVKSGGKGHFKNEDHIKVAQQALQVLLPLLPAGIPVTLLGDGEFDSIDLQKLCLKNDWNYVLRTACNTILYEQGERFQARDIQLSPLQDCFSIPQVEFTADRFKYVHFVCWHDVTKYEKPIYLISNLLCDGAIIELYNQRYAIECLFKDLKSTRFNLHKTRLKKPKEVFNLIIIAALAFILLTVIAIQYDQKKWRKKVQRVRKDQKVLSFFTFACKLIDYFLDYDIHFSFSFHFSKNSKSNAKTVFIE